MELSTHNVANQWDTDTSTLSTEHMWEHYEWCLKNHDWYYSYSDDHRYWVKGEKTSKHLKEVKQLAESLDPSLAERLYNDACPWC